MKKILVIEDEAQIRENIQLILDLSDYKTIVAENGSVGVRLAKAEQPHLIICDIMMPELDGYGVAKSLQSHSPTESIPMIFLTAKADRGDLRQAMELGVDDYITKPFTPEELLKAVEVRLARAEKPTQLRQKYEQERQQNAQLRQEIQAKQQKLQQSQQLADMRQDILHKLSQDLRNPLSNINMAICMLQAAQSDAERQRYMSILEEECAREIKLLNEIENLQTLLTPENAKILQKFNLLNQSK
ncbi:response regulator [Scytonema sp. UIC 10036]|uniref:ATP-binding response regulator n=1 Tax=Scytonema sp. UIC 10036 TaxID=2304196 RepID=UPI0012DAC693|nr:response regulator [Scytonema sp. UIC 10036]MUG99754.1 response regulator [Scytonema sp. UIC 10036]